MSQKTFTQEQKAAKAAKERARYAAKNAKPAPAKHEVGSHITFTTARKNKVSGTMMPNANQWLNGNDDKRISIVGGKIGLYGDGVTTFEMMHPDMGGDVQGWMSKEEINEYLSKHPLQ